MPKEPDLATRVRLALGQRRVEEKHMFGGLCFLVDGRMACGVVGEELVVRVELEDTLEALKLPATRPMLSEGKIMRGFLYVGPAGLAARKDLQAWVDRGIARAASMGPRPTKATKATKGGVTRRRGAGAAATAAQETGTSAKSRAKKTRGG